ncbi:MAG: thiolase domain-containing protein [Candidatus Eisenbacteria sp.]|nr:thiolase domain-containing protein [Candidatus Eisenbacteria bacterium]
MRDVAIIAAGQTKFARTEWPLIDLLVEGARTALADVEIDESIIQAVVVANMGAGILNHQSGVASAVVDGLGLFPAHAELVENGPASGASAVKMAFLGIAAGYYDVVLVIGGEKMRAVNGWESTDFVATLTHPFAEYIYGVTLPSMAGLFARLYMEKYGITPEHLAMVAIKNHNNAMFNPEAHVQQRITMEGILHRPEAVVNNPIVADPLRMFDCCPVSDGAAGLVLCAAERAGQFTDKPVLIAGVGQATDTHVVHEREDPTDLKAVTLASEQAFKMARVGPDQVDVAELHDAFTILEIAESEHAGFFPKGEGHKALERGETQIGGKLPINPSGGLKARGHPVGATGIAQLVEITKQLRGDAGQRQVKKAKTGFTLNFGGFGNNVLAFVLKKT